MIIINVIVCIKINFINIKHIITNHYCKKTNVIEINIIIELARQQSFVECVLSFLQQRRFEYKQFIYFFNIRP